MNLQKNLLALGFYAVMGTSISVGVELKEADITTVKNIVERNEGAGAMPAKVNDKIHENSKVSTAAASMAELTFSDSSITRMGANTQFSFQSKERLVKLDQGTVLIHTPPGNGGATVDCGGVTAAVTGTTFMASHDVSGNVMFVLLEGQGGLKVTVGGTSTVIRPGQAASIGADAKKEASPQESSATPGGDKVVPGTGSNAKAEEKGGGGAEGGSAPGSKSSTSPSTGGGESTTTPAPAAPPPPKIQVFDVDVKKVVATTPLIVDFKKELPSVSKIEKVIETQQSKVQEGKLEKTETEVVLIKHEDGDILVGSPKVNAEETVVVNRKEDVVTPGGGAKDNLDVETAAGPGAGAPSPDARPVAAAAPPPAAAPAPPPPVITPPVNPGQIVVVPPTPSTIAITAKIIDSSRFFNQNNPSFGFSITSGSLLAGHSLVTDFLTSATPASPVSGAPYSVNFANTKIVDGSGADVTSRYNLTTVAGVLNVLKAAQNVSFGAVGSLTYDQSVNLVASALAGPTTFELVNPADSSKVSITGGQLKALSGTGTVEIRAVTSGDANYNAASATQTITLGKAAQSVNFSLPTTPLTFDTMTALGATATGAGNVTFELVNPADSSKVSIRGGQIKALSGTGIVQIRAMTMGDENYDLASTIQTITLGKAAQSVNFTLPTTPLTYNTGTGLTASALDSGTVSFQVISGPATIDGSGRLVATSGTGSVVVRASASGDQNYNGAFAEQTITLQKAAQNLTATAVLPRLTGSSGTIPINGVMVGTPTFSVLESDGRATVDSLGNVTVGKILGANSFTLRADAATDSHYLSAQKDLSVAISRNVPAIEAANPTRQLLSLPDPTDLAALDEFFYFTGKATGYSGGPDRFFANAGVGDTDRTLNTPGASASLYSGQSWDFYAARNFTALPGAMATSPTAGKLETVFYANTIDLGNPNPQWQGLGDPRLDSASLGYRYLTLHSDYSPTFLAVIDSTSGEPYGFTDPFGSNYFPLQNFPVWDDEGGMITSTDLVHVDVVGSTHWTLAAGMGGIAARGLEVAANGAGVQMMTSGDMDLKTVKISDVGSGQSGDTLVMEARGKVKMGVDASIDLNLNTSAGLAEGQQVRLEGRTDAVGSALSGSLAVVRTGDSLELRNVTIRGFAETRLEKLNSTTKAVEGRVLISGSAVRDFKIKELVGAAVNADAKIQMMALDTGGQLAGDMVVEGRMPVQAKIASALAEAGENLPSATANAMVDAHQIDLAARNLKFDNANLVAMNAITARANTILVQNSFMTVLRNQGMINMYVQSGLVNPNYGTMTDGRVNFAGSNTFRIGGTTISITDQASLTAAYGNALVDINQNGGAPQAGKVNVLKL